jgi:hypothetical protein
MTDQLAALIRGEHVDGLRADWRWERLRDAAEHHAVLPLVADGLLAAAGTASVFAAGLSARVRRAAVAEAVREVELASLLDVLGRASVGALLFKGAALAYTCYGRPELRPRLDTDLLIPEQKRSTAAAVLRDLGYEVSGHFSGDLVAYQAAYLKRRRDAVVHVVDLHWRLSNPQPFGDVLTYEEAAAEAVPVVELGAQAWTLSAVHALLVACVHRVAHHSTDQRLIWAVDIDRLAGRYTAPDWERFVTLAIGRRVAAVCRRGLTDAQHVCHTAVPEAVLDELGQAVDDEPTAAFLRPRRHAAVVAQDLAAMPTWGSRVRLLRQHAFPPATYMRGVYAPASSLPLPLLYLRRAWHGARKWLGRT